MPWILHTPSASRERLGGKGVLEGRQPAQTVPRLLGFGIRNWGFRDLDTRVGEESESESDSRKQA